MDPHLLRAVLDDPADDAPRLILADWLEERDAEGDAARAEFIRVQCELASLEAQGAGRMTSPLLDFRYVSLRRRERELLVAHYRAWFRRDMGALADKVVWLDAEKAYRRGFVDSVSCAAADWLGHGPGVVRHQPVTEVRLTGIDPVGPIAGGPNQGGWFYLRRDLGEAMWHFLFAGTHLEHEATTAALPSAEEAASCLSAGLILKAKAVNAAQTARSCAVE